VRWATSARPGEAIVARGPRGRTRLAEGAQRRLFVGDETAAPAIFAMAEAMGSDERGLALIEVDGPGETQPPASEADFEVRWVFRDGASPGPSPRLLERLIEIDPQPADAHAYLLGETSNVRALRHWLLGRGFAKDQITAEGYWRPGRIGGHDHV